MKLQIQRSKFSILISKTTDLSKTFPHFSYSVTYSLGDNPGYLEETLWHPKVFLISYILITTYLFTEVFSKYQHMLLCTIQSSKNQTTVIFHNSLRPSVSAEFKSIISFKEPAAQVFNFMC